MKHYITAVMLFLLPALGQAELYFELALEGGGETLARTTSGFELTAGGGVKFAGGVKNRFGEDNNSTLSLALGYLTDSINASNGEGDLDSFTFDAIYGRMFEAHRLGVGLSYHIGPEYSDRVDGFGSSRIDFDDALGIIFQYGYALTPGFQLGARYTIMDYKTNAVSIDADSFGIYLATGF